MDAAVVASTYLRHLAHGNAIPLAFIPSEQTIAAAETLVRRVDGLLLLGGADIDPACYNATPEPTLEATVPLRDRSEIALVAAAIRIGTPVFGICRGLHVMNVAAGGTLQQDIGEIGPSRHRKAPGRLDEGTHHDIEVLPGSQLERAIGAGTHKVNSHHHQAVAQLGQGARVTATSPIDSLVEAVEWDTPGFAVGVQWHPEAGQPGGTIEHFLAVCRGDRSSSNAES